jgi:hypothetical protein
MRNPEGFFILCAAIDYLKNVWYYSDMKKYGEELKITQAQVTLAEFMAAFNQTMPSQFPRATTPLLKKFKEAHAGLFTNGDMWSLDIHRKKVIDWLPKHVEPTA